MIEAAQLEFVITRGRIPASALARALVAALTALQNTTSSIRSLAPGPQCAPHPRGRGRISLSNHLTALALAFLCPGGCGDAAAPSETRFTFSFEKGMEGWTIDAMACEPDGSLCAPWSIDRTADLAYRGEHAIKFYMDNVIDGATIWIVRPFPVTPGRSYDIEVSYAFGSADWGDVNLFQLLTGAFRAPPAHDSSFRTGMSQVETGNGAARDTGYQWLRKSFRHSVRADANGQVFVVVGIWGTWETARTYFLDDLTVQLAPR